MQKSVVQKLAIIFVFIMIACTASKAYPIGFNEIMFNPDGSDAGREWIELYGECANLSQYRFFESNTNHNIACYGDCEGSSTDCYQIISNDHATFMSTPWFQREIIPVSIQPFE